VGGDAADLVEKARRALRAAGERAFALNNYASAASLFDEALALWPDDEERPRLLFLSARALYAAYDDRREPALESARDALLAAGDTASAAEAESYLSQHFWYRGQGELARAHLAHAEELAGDTVSASAARVLAVSARTRTIADEAAESLRTAEVALAMSKELGLDELHAHALTTVGLAKNSLGDSSEGTKDLERALALAVEIDSPVASTTVNNLAVLAFLEGRLRRAHELYTEALRLALRFGDAASARFVRVNVLFLDLLFGHWDAALAEAETFIAECEAGSPHTQESVARIARGIIREARGNSEGALADHRRALELARESGTLGPIVAALARSASTHVERGELTEARRLAEELIPKLRKHGPHGAIGELADVAKELGIASELRAVFEDSSSSSALSPWRIGILMALNGDLRGAADFFAEMGNQLFAARMRLRAAERLLARGEPATDEIEQALAFYRSVGATHYIGRAEALLHSSAYSDSA